MMGEKEILAVCLLWFYKDLYYNEEEKLSNKYWYSEFDSSRDEYYKYQAKQRYDIVKQQVDKFKKHVGYFISEYATKNKLLSEDLFDYDSCGRTGRLMPNKFNKIRFGRHYNYENIVEDNFKIYNNIRKEFYTWCSEQEKKQLEYKEKMQTV